MILAEDDPTVLDEIIIYGQNLAVNWTDHHEGIDSRLFEKFPDHLIKAMH